MAKAHENTPMFTLFFTSRSYKTFFGLDLMVFKKAKVYYAWHGLYRSPAQARQAALRLTRPGLKIRVTSADM